MNSILNNPANKVHLDLRKPDGQENDRVFVSGLINIAVKKRKCIETQDDEDEDQIQP